MSLRYHINKRTNFETLVVKFSGNKKRARVYIHKHEQDADGEKSIVLSDGYSYLHAYDNNGHISFAFYGGESPDNIIRSIETKLRGTMHEGDLAECGDVKCHGGFQCDNCERAISQYQYRKGQGLCPVCIDAMQ